MTTAAEMRARSDAGRKARADAYGAEQAEKAEHKAALETTIRDTISAYCEEHVLPKLVREAYEGRTRVSMSLGYAESPEVRFRARYLKPHLESMGYTVETPTQFRRHSDDDRGSDEIDLVVSW